MRVLITGIGGFIGAHCLEYLLEKTDWEILGIDSFRHKGTYSRLNEISAFDHSRVKIFNHDLTVPIDLQLENQLLEKTLEGQKEIDYIINFASDSAVERSIENPSHCWRNNCELILNMLEFTRRVNPKLFLQISTDEVYGDAEFPHKEWDAILPSNPYSASKAAQEALCVSYWRTFKLPIVIVNCHDEKTQAFTPNGIKNVDDLAVGDLVWSIDKSGNLVKTPILNIIKKQYAGLMININHKNTNQCVTPEHRVMGQKPSGKPRRYNEFTYVEASELKKVGRFRIPTTAFWEGKHFENIETKFLVNQDDLHFNSKLLPESVNANALFGLIGWYVSEGSLGRGISIPQKSILNRQNIIKCFKDLGITPCNDKHGINLQVCCKPLWLFLSKFGKKAEDKHIPNWILDCSKENLQCLFNSAVKGDGSFKQHKDLSCYSYRVFYTKSKCLAWQMSEIGIKLGYSCQISKRRTWNPAKTKKSLSYVVRFRNATADIEQRNLLEEEKIENVWCLQVATGNFFIVRNGIISCSGNCMNAIGEWQDKEKFLPKLVWKIATGQEMEIYGEPGKIGTRFYLHCKTIADALLHITKLSSITYDRPPRYNIVGNLELNNLEMAQYVASIIGKPLNFKLIPAEAARKGYDKRYWLDGQKLAACGWKPPEDTLESIKKVVEWTLAHPHWLL